MDYRKLTLQEEKLLNLLVSKAITLDLSGNWKDNLQVQPMKDGGMGSLRLLPHGKNSKDSHFGKTVSEYLFFDKDGVQVIASLNVDTNGKLFELDIWKTDFSPLLRIPEQL